MTTAIGLGSNLGDCRAQLEGALAILASTKGVRVVGVSPWYRTTAVGPPQPDYLNGCALLETQLPAPVLMELLLAIEIRFGRFRGERWGARSLDLDLLFYGDRTFHTPTLQVPHPRLQDRGFVLVPLAKIAPWWRHPASGHTVVELLEAWHRQQPDGSMGSSGIVESPPHAQPLLRRSAPPGD